MLHVMLKDTKEVVRLGNSLTWGYSIDESGGVHFYHKGADVTSALKNNGANNPNLVLKPGDNIYFDADGKESKYGIDTPPKDPFRRVFWEAGLPSKRELFHVVSEEEVKEFFRECRRDYNDNIEEIQMRVPGSCWYEYDDVSYHVDGNIVFCAQVHRDWYHQWWHLTAVYCVRSAYTVEHANAVLEKLRSRYPN